MITILGKYKEYFFIVDDNQVFNKESYIESQKSKKGFFIKNLQKLNHLYNFYL